MVSGVGAPDRHTVQKFCISKEIELSVRASDPISEDIVGRRAEI